MNNSEKSVNVGGFPTVDYAGTINILSLMIQRCKTGIEKWKKQSVNVPEMAANAISSINNNIGFIESIKGILADGIIPTNEIADKLDDLYGRPYFTLVFKLWRTIKVL